MTKKTARRTPPTLAHVWLAGLGAAVIAVAAIIVKTQFDHRRGPMHHSFVAWIAVPVLLISGIYAVGRLADGMGRFLARRQIIIGFGLAGVVLGIAAQQSLGNIFASLVLIFARPFSVGEHIRVRSGTVGVLDAWVLGIGLTYVTLQTEDGLLKVPNSVILASGIGKLDTPPHRLP
jgi:hypothetical protein